MSLVLTTRAGNGAPLTANQFDANMNAIASAVNTNSSDITTKVSTSTFDGLFQPTVSGKKQVAWTDVTAKPAELTERYCFRAYRGSADQTISASGTLNIDLDGASFNTGSGFNSSTHQFVAVVAGYYHFDFGAQVQLVSGSPSAISIIAYIKVDGSHYLLSTLDNSGTGTRIYRGAGVFKLNVGSVVNMSVDFSFTGTATWSVSGNGDGGTSLSGFLIMPS